MFCYFPELRAEGLQRANQNSKNIQDMEFFLMDFTI